MTEHRNQEEDWASKKLSSFCSGGSFERQLREIRTDLCQLLSKESPSVFSFIGHPWNRTPKAWDCAGSHSEQATQAATAGYRHGLKLILPAFDAMLRTAATTTKKAKPFLLEVCLGQHNHENLIRLEVNAKSGQQTHRLHVDTETTKKPLGTSEPTTLFRVGTLKNDFDVLSALFGPTSILWQEGIAAATQLLTSLELQPSTQNVRTVLGALFQLNSVLTETGCSSAFGYLRPAANPFEFSVGSTALLKDPSFNQSALMQAVDNCVDELNTALLPEGNFARKGVDDLAGALRSRVSATNHGSIPNVLLDTILKKMLVPPDMCGTVGKQVQTFLNDAVMFSDRREEGRSLEYGIVLANPLQLRYWPGARPLPILPRERPGGNYNGALLSEIIAQIHLIENPRHRFLVMPYGADYPLSQSNTHPGIAFALDVAGFREAIASWRDGLLWSTTGVIYAWLTHAYPGTVAAIVGPGSRMRVFVGGSFVAHRDAKGWNFVPAEPVSERPIVQAVGEVAMHLSPFVRPKATGGFLLWSPGEIPRYTRENHDSEITRVPLGGLEPPKLDRANTPWLTRQKLLGKDHSINLEVGKLLLRTTMIDGAVLLKGDECEIYDFGQRINVTPKITDLGLGTKRATAQAFVQAVEGDAFAFAVSADGPVRLFHSARTTPDNWLADELHGR